MEMGQWIADGQWFTVLDYIEGGKREGERLMTGGGRLEYLAQGYFIAPTIFDDVEPGMQIFKEEIFGPVLAVATAANLEEALARANAVEYGLTTSIFTQDITAVMRFIEDVEVGMVHVNEPTVGGEAQLPFGGTKSTGVGEREMAEEGLHFFTELKTVFINYSGKAERSLTR
jgi:aldehyde dehydrogenase (NAD+)